VTWKEGKKIFFFGPKVPHQTYIPKYCAVRLILLVRSDIAWYLKKVHYWKKYGTLQSDDLIWTYFRKYPNTGQQRFFRHCLLSQTPKLPNSVPDIFRLGLRTWSSIESASDIVRLNLARGKYDGQNHHILSALHRIRAQVTYFTTTQSGWLTRRQHIATCFHAWKCARRVETRYNAWELDFCPWTTAIYNIQGLFVAYCAFSFKSTGVWRVTRFTFRHFGSGRFFAWHLENFDIRTENFVFFCTFWVIHLCSTIYAYANHMGCEDRI
jgi:hypothetical protein